MVLDIDNEGGYVHSGAQGRWEISVSSALFCQEPKIALKSKVYYKKKKLQGLAAWLK
jgi:hypothetical protein